MPKTNVTEGCQTPPNPEVAKLELIDLIRDRRIVLDRTGRPLPPTGEVWDRADWQFINSLWAESKEDRQWRDSENG